MCDFGEFETFVHLIVSPAKFAERHSSWSGSGANVFEEVREDRISLERRRESVLTGDDSCFKIQNGSAAAENTCSSTRSWLTGPGSLIATAESLTAVAAKCLENSGTDRLLGSCRLVADRGRSSGVFDSTFGYARTIVA